MPWDLSVFDVVGVRGAGSTAQTPIPGCQRQARATMAPVGRQGDPDKPGGAAIAIRLADLVSQAGPAAQAGRTALVVAGTPGIRAGEQLVFVKVVAAAPAVVRRDGRVQASGHPADHARLGALEQQLDELAGPGVIASRCPPPRCWAPGGRPWAPRRWPRCRDGC